MQSIPSIQRISNVQHGNLRVCLHMIIAVGIVCGVMFDVVRLAAADEESRASVKAAEQLWFGTMEIKDIRHFRFALRLTHQNGAWSGVLSSLDEGGQDFDLSGVIKTDSQLRFELPQTAAAFEGRWDAGKKSMVGIWKQRGQEFALAFRRVEKLPQRNVKTIWKGTIDAVIQKLDVAFVELESGELFFNSISQKAGGFIAKNDSKDGTIIYRVPAVQGKFEGELSDDKSQILGKWSQGLAKLDLTLKRAVAKDLAAKPYRRPQTPQPPFPYASRDVSFVSKDPKVKLAGTLTIPNGKIAAAVVLVSGSGPQDRDESLLGHKPFWVIADHFARHGIATLRYDDRGTARSTGDFASATSFDFADDAEWAAEYLRGLPEFAEVSVGICGHSEGGMIAPIVASRNKHIGFVIMMAGTGVTGEEVLYRQAKLILEAEGASASEINKQAKFQRALLSTVIQHQDASQSELESKLADVLAGEVDAGVFEKEELNEMVQAGLAKVGTPWFRTFLTYDPKKTLTKLQCPVLVINGEKDLQVDPKLNLPAITAALRSTRDCDFEIVEYPGLNHLFQQCKTGSVSEYEAIEETFNIKPLEKMTTWILSLRTVK